MENISRIIAACSITALIMISTGCNRGNNISTEEINTVVETYMKHTLGTIFRADVDYEKAKKLLTPDLEAQFINPMFVPASYCIQDGPSNVRIISTELDAEMNWVNVTVEGMYGEDWQRMWEFTVVPVEGDDWMIQNIICLHM